MDERSVERRIELLEKKKERAEGARKQLLKQLKNEFNCETVKEAKKLLVQFKREENETEEQLKKELTKFEQQYGGKVEMGYR